MSFFFIYFKQTGIKKKNTLKFWKIFSRTIKPISMKLGTNHPLVKEIQNCSKGQVPFIGGQLWNSKNRDGSFKTLFKNYKARKAKIYRKAPWRSGNPFQIMVPGVKMGHNKENHFYTCLYGENVSKIFSRTIGPEKLKFTWKLSDIAQKQVC
jgi:hypothetical protein